MRDARLADLGAGSDGRDYVRDADCHILYGLKARFTNRPLTPVALKVNRVKTYIERLEILYLTLKLPVQTLNLHALNLYLFPPCPDYLELERVRVRQFLQGGKDHLQK